MELVALQSAIPEISAAGATLVAISPQVVENNHAVTERHELTFDVLSDQGNRVAEEFGLVFKLPDDLRKLYMRFGIDLPKVNGDDSWTLPMPARFVIDQAGIIQAADVNPDYTRRPDPERTVEILKALQD